MDPPCYRDLVGVFSKSEALSFTPSLPLWLCNRSPSWGASALQQTLQSIGPREEVYARLYRVFTLFRYHPTLHIPLGGMLLFLLFFVTKKDKTLTLCIDYRLSNQITIKNKYPLSLINSVFEQLQGTTIFSKLNLHNAYLLVCIKEGNEWKTAFRTPLGHFEYLVMPFGLTNTHTIFQALVNDVLRDFLSLSSFTSTTFWSIPKILINTYNMSALYYNAS